jgi:hypothetical protein
MAFKFNIGFTGAGGLSSGHFSQLDWKPGGSGEGL